jgi:hypothetical protein
MTTANAGAGGDNTPRFSERLLHPYLRARVWLGREWRKLDRETFDDRSRGRERLLTILAGHKPYLWPWTLDRIINAVPPDLDVCIVTPGVLQNPLREMAAENGWSYLSTQHGQVSVAQNRALAHHPSARLIYKIDEDIFISSGFFEAMDAGYAAVVEEGRYRPGFCSPLINVNGFSYVDFLRARGLEEAYVAEFGELRRAADGIKAHHDGQAAVWLWRNSLPVDDVAADFAKRPAGYSPVPHRFSIGAILFERSLWEKMGGFRRGLKAPGLGVDEEHICESCVAFSRTMIVLDNVYAGHFAFGPQESAMREEFETRLSGF